MRELCQIQRVVEGEISSQLSLDFLFWNRLFHSVGVSFHAWNIVDGDFGPSHESEEGDVGHPVAEDLKEVEGLGFDSQVFGVRREHDNNGAIN